MAKQIECGKFLVIECTAKEMREATHNPVVMCDYCADVALSANYKGYYIAVLNQWFCKSVSMSGSNERHTTPKTRLLSVGISSITLSFSA